MSFGFGFALPAYPLRGGGGNNPFNQLGPTLDLSFTGVVTDLTDPNGYTLNTDFIIPQYQIAAQYVVWETGVGLVDKTFSQIITFTRASIGTYFDSAGVLQTATSGTPRFDYDPVTLAPRGFLIEEARTNLITSSAVLPAGVNVTITADTFVAPDGTTTGDQILDNATLGEHYSDSSFTPVAATNYTLSAFIKNIGASSSGFACLRLAGDFNAFVIVNLSTFTVATTGGAQYVSSSVQAINNGWYRISLTGVSVGTVASVARVQVTDAANLAPYSGTGEGFAVWGRQLEAGAFPTSYIPTTTGTVPRNADVASVNTLSPWFNSTTGTFYTESVLARQNATGGLEVASIRNAGSTSYIRTFYRASGATGQSVLDTSVIQCDLTATGVISANTTVKMALAYAANDFAASGNGGAVVTDPAGTVPSGLTDMQLGGVGLLNGWLRRVTYYPRRLTNDEIRTLTLPTGATITTQDYSLDTNFVGNTVAIGS